MDAIHSPLHAADAVNARAAKVRALSSARQSRRPGDELPLLFWRDQGQVTQPDRLVRRLLGTASLALVIGEPGSGKTFLVTDVALHITLGRAWFGRAVSPGTVIYVAAEGAAGLGNRIAAFRKKHDTPPDVPFVVIPASVNLGPEGQDADKIIAAAERVVAETGQAVVLVVIDTLARANGGGDENSAADMGVFVTACGKICQALQATILIVHHKGKSANAGARGSSALMGAVDTCLEIEKRESGRVCKVIKQKDGQDGAEFGFALDVVEIGEDDEGQPITSCVVRPTDEIAKVMPKPSAMERRALDALNNCIIEHGERAPQSVTFPNVTLVKIDLFREHLKSVGVTDRDAPANERSQWRRLTGNLANKGLIAMRDAYIWPTVAKRDIA